MDWLWSISIISYQIVILHNFHFTDDVWTELNGFATSCLHNLHDGIGNTGKNFASSHKGINTNIQHIAEISNGHKNVRWMMTWCQEFDETCLWLICAPIKFCKMIDKVTERNKCLSVFFIDTVTSWDQLASVTGDWINERMGEWVWSTGGMILTENKRRISLEKKTN